MSERSTLCLATGRPVSWKSHPHKIEGLPDGHALRALFSPTAESFGVSAQIGSWVVRGGPEVRFHEGSTRVLPGFYQGSTKVLRGRARALKRAPHAVGDIT